MVHAAICRLRRMAGGSHRAIVVAIAALLPILVTCDSPTEPEDPSSVEAQIKGIFPPGTSTRTAALAQVADIRQQIALGATAQARTKVLALVDFTMTAFREGKLVGGTSEAAGNAASALVNSLYQLVGMEPPNLPDGSLNEDGAAKVIGPEGGEIVTPSGAAGVQIPPGAIDQSVLVTVTRLPTPPVPGTGPLPTALKQYGPYYEYATYPEVAQFADSVRVGVCQVTDPSSPFYAPEPHERLRLAHKVGAGIQILARIGVSDFLRCTDVSASVAPPHGWRGALSALAGRVIGRVTPAPAYAAHGGLGGKVRSFSPFGAVDPAVTTVTVTLASPTVVAGNTNQASAVLKDADGNVLTDRVIAWTSSNEALATISSTGLITGVAEGGPVTITATSEGQSGTAAVTVTPAPVALVTVSPSSPTVNAGETLQLAATTTDSRGNFLTGRVVSWTSSDNARATVSSSGLVTGVAEGGPVTITATSEGQSGTAAVTVTPAPVALVTVTPTSPTINVGTTVQLAATTKASNGNVLTDRVVSWTSSNNGLATVSSSGLVTGISEGPVTITASSEGQSGTANVTVTPAPVATVALSPSSPSVNVGATVQLSATTNDASGNVLTGRIVNWTSSNNGLATVSSSGLVTGISEGPVTITATSEGQSGTANVIVTPAPVATVAVSPLSSTINVAATVQLSATTKEANGNVLTGRVVDWTSSNNGLATVSSSGLVTGVAEGGPVTITASSEGQSGTATVTVTPIPVTSVTVTPPSSTINVGATTQLTAATKDANGNVLTGRVITWTSSNNPLATVSSSGLVTAVAVGGPVTITATSEGQSGTAAVTVTPVPVATVTVTPTPSTINVAATVQLTATTKDAGANVLTGRAVTWGSSNTALATVSPTGLVTGVAAGGPVTITATSEGISGTAAVTVTLVPVATVTVTPATPTVFVAATLQLTATTKDASSNVLTGRVITWASSNEALATVSTSGLVTGVAVGGPVTITATSEGQSGTSAVTVTLAPVATVTVSPPSPTVTAGSTLQLSATTKDANNNVLTGRVVTWASNNEPVATVSSTGLVTGVTVGGPVTITATSEGQSGTAAVTVTPVPVATVTVSPATPTVTVGLTVQLGATTKDAGNNVLTGRTVTWMSSNEALATVSGTGLVTGVAVGGPVTITATSEGQSGTASLTVSPVPVATVTVTPASSTIEVEETVQLAATTKDASNNVLTGRVITWTSSNEALATVSATGLVTGVAVGGPVTITATSEGQSGTASVTMTAIVSFTPPAARMEVGEATVCALNPSDAVYCWGENDRGQYGATSLFAPARSSPVFTVVPTLQEFAVGARQGFCGITSARTGICWGRGGLGEQGGGVAGGFNGQQPTLVAGGINWGSFSVSRLSGCGVSNTGVGYCWGNNQKGEIGSAAVPLLTFRTSPTQIDGGLTFRSVVGGWIHACGITTAGDAYCWGDNTSGQLGIGAVDATNHRSPEPVAGTQKFVQLTLGAKQTCGITIHRRVYCWGENATGQLGDGTTTRRSSPTPVASGLRFVYVATASGFTGGTSVIPPEVPVQAGVAHTCALADGGTPYCWGWNGNGQLGDGSTTDRQSPVAVVGGLSLTTIGLGGSATCGMQGSSIWCWGANAAGQLGNGSVVPSSSPILVGAPVVPVASVTVTPSPSSVGVGSTIQLTATTKDFSSNVLTGRVISWMSSNTSLATVSSNGLVTALAVGGPVTITATSEGINGTASVTVIPVPVATVTVSPSSSTINVGTTVQLTATTRDAGSNVLTGRVITWMSSDNAVATVSSSGLVSAIGVGGPVTITATSEGQSGTAAVTSAALDFASLTSGFYHTCGLTNTGKAYCWGLNSSGELGRGIIGGLTSAPTLVAGGLTFTRLVGGALHTCGLTTAGTAYCWGSNFYGQLGDGTATNRPTPTLVGGGLTFTGLGLGWYHTCGLTSTGTAYCWGLNDNSQLGDGTTTLRSTPTPVAGGFTFSNLAGGARSTCGLSTGGIAYCWGLNNEGQLGDGTVATRTTPVLVTGGLTFTSIATGTSHSCALTTGGTAYCWGGNSFGAVGDGTTIARLAPTQVAGGFTFTSLATGYYHSCAISSGGASYCWGFNFYGQVGDETNTNRLTPTLVAGEHTFSSLAIKGEHSCGRDSGGRAYCWGFNLYGEVGDGTTTDRLIPTLVLYQAAGGGFGLRLEPQPSSRQTPRRLSSPKLQLQPPTPPPISR